MYLVTIYERADYPNGGQVLLDTSSGTNPGVVSAACDGTLNEAGSVTFSIVKGHPQYDSIHSMRSYVSVEMDGEEIFYGRVLAVQKNPLTLNKTITCEGALTFLMDAELDKESEESTRTAAAEFRRCIGIYNDKVGTDAARNFTVGSVSADGASTLCKFKNGSRVQIQSHLKSKLLGVGDGFFSITKSGTAHAINWTDQVGRLNPQPIRIAQNVTSHSTTESGEDIFTVLRPMGNNDLAGSAITVNQSMRQQYGKIERTVTFDADDADDLQAKANAYVAKLQYRVTLSGEIGFVDMHYLDGTVPQIHLGDVFTNIDGYEGTKLTVATIHRDLLNPANDKLSLKTDKDLMSTAGSNGTNSSSSTSGSGVSSSRGRSSTGASKWYKYIHETTDNLSLATKNIQISAEEKIALVARNVEIVAENVSSVAADVDDNAEAIDGLNGEWTTYKGTAIYQNKDSIATVAGKFSVNDDGDVLLQSGTSFIIDQNGTATNVGELTANLDERVDGLGDWVTEYTGSYTYQHRNEIGSIVGQYTIDSYVDPEHPYAVVTPGPNDSPRSYGYFEKVGDEYVYTTDIEVVAGKTYYKSNDIVRGITFDSGGGYKIKENGVEYGVYTEGNLDGGVIVEKLNDGSTTTKIKGTRVIIGDNPSALDAETLPDWADATEGLIAEKATIVNLNAVIARVGTLEADTIKTANLASSIANITNLSAQNLNVASLTSERGGISVASVATNSLTIGGTSVGNSLIVSASVDGNTLTLTPLVGRAITFSKATTLSPAWNSGGKALTVNATQTNDGVTTNVGHYYIDAFSIGGGWGDGSIEKPVETTYYGKIQYYSSSESSSEVYSDTGKTFTVDASGVYSDGRAQGRSDVYIVKGSWTNGTITFEKSTGGSAKTVDLQAAGTTWDGTTATRAIYDGDPEDGGISTNWNVSVDVSGKLEARTYSLASSDISSVTISPSNANYLGMSSVVVDTSAVYEAGFDAVSAPTFKSWSIAQSTYPASDFTTNSITFETDQKNSGAARDGYRLIFLGKGNWSSGDVVVTLRDNVRGGDFIGRITVSMPTTASISGTVNSSDKTKYDITCTPTGGISYTQTISTLDSYNSGWANAYRKVDILPDETLPTGTERTSFHVETPPSTVNGAAVSNTFNITKGSTPGASGYVAVSNGQTVVGRISIGDWYTAGYSKGSPISGTAGGRTTGVSGYVHDFTITKGDSTTATLQIDCSDIYSTARTGYSLGSYTQATVTPQGTAYGSITPISGSGVIPTKITINQAVNGDTYLLRKGTAYKVTKKTIKECGSTTYYFKSFSSATKPTGTWYERYTSKPSGTSSEMYFAKTPADYYTVPSGAGDGTNLYKSDGTSPTLYEASSVTYYNVGSTYSGKRLYEAGTAVENLRNPGTEDSTTYYTKS